MYKENLDIVNNNIKAACLKTNRSVDEVTLIAVSKTKPINMIEGYYNLGVSNFGENKVNELCDKKNILPKDIIWHFIGHLQTNKVKKIIKEKVLIHSIDSIKLIKQLQNEASKLDIQVQGLLELNVAKEESKFGFYVDELDLAIEEIKKSPNIKINGLMTIAPFVDNPENNRNIFKTMKNIFIDIKTKNIDNIKMSILSMGMSNDYIVAIEEGATMVRIGTDLFGNRVYSNS